MAAVRTIAVTSACEADLHLWCGGRLGAKGRGRPCGCPCHQVGRPAARAKGAAS